MTATPTRSANLMQLNAEWANRPDDQRFLTLDELHRSVLARREQSWTTPFETNSLRVGVPDQGAGLDVVVRDRSTNRDRIVNPTNWGFGQLAQLGGAPAGYLRKLPAPLAAINLQWGFEQLAARSEGLLLAQQDGTMRATTSTTYGRIYDSDVVEAVQRVNHDGRWRVPASSYDAKQPRRATTLYASDRDVWLFLCDPENVVEVDGERLFRGFMVWNSEVGASAFGLRVFLYRYVCDNRIVWGARDVRELIVRHTAGAPDRFSRDGQRMLKDYAESSTASIVQAVRGAKAEVVAGDGKTETAVDWLTSRGFARSLATASVKQAVAEEGKARTLWDIVQGITAVARGIEKTDERVELETRAGRLMETVAG